MAEEPTRLDISDEMIAERKGVQEKCQMICQNGWHHRLQK